MDHNMATEIDTDTSATFPGLPPFPHDIPTAPLLRLSLAKLLRESAPDNATPFPPKEPAAPNGPPSSSSSSSSSETESESTRLWNACRELGFFYLDLRGCPEGEALLRDADRLFQVGEELFANMTAEDREAFDFEKKGSYHGYKGMGKAVLDANGTLDRNEFYNVSKDDLLSLTPSPLPSPPLLSANQTLLTHYATTSHAMTTLILSQLSRRLDIPPTSPDYLPNLHRLDHASGDQIRFLRAPPPPPPAEDESPIKDKAKGDAALGAHTDFGSVTILFNRLGGLQVLLPPSLSSTEKEEEEWRYVRPLPGHAIVNLGDALVKFSRGALRSNVHRVTAAPGQQREHTKYSLVYFARPEEDVLLRPLLPASEADGLRSDESEESPAMTSKEWILRRALGKRVGNFEKVGWEGTQGTETTGRSAVFV